MWIEIKRSVTASINVIVTPCAGVWIEIPTMDTYGIQSASLPVRECGLKFDRYYEVLECEASLPVRECGLKFPLYRITPVAALSLPVRECGLKCVRITNLLKCLGHSLCGSVD